MIWKYQRIKRVPLAHKFTHAAPVESNSDESDIESSDKEEPLKKISKEC